MTATSNRGRVSITWRRPPAAEVTAFLQRAAELELSYERVVAAASGSLAEAPVGFDIDHHRFRLGDGPAVWSAARRALAEWAMFPPEWTHIAPRAAEIAVGRTVAVQFHLFGLWWLNSARIVDRIDAGSDDAPWRQRFGFAYGTLPCHVECGEERFMVEQLADGSVWYDLRAFSRPRFWLARLAKPWVRALQRRFVRGSQAALAAAVERGVRAPPSTSL